MCVISFYVISCAPFFSCEFLVSRRFSSCRCLAIHLWPALAVMKHWRVVEMRKIKNNATNATLFYNNNASPIMRGAKETCTKALFSKFCNIVPQTVGHAFVLFFVKAAVQIRYAVPPSCCSFTKQYFCKYLKNYEFL